MNKNLCNDKMKYIYDKVWDLRKDAETKINNSIVIFSIMFSSFLIIVNYFYVSKNENKNVFIISTFFLVLVIITSFMIMFLIFLALTPKNDVKIKEKKLKKFRNIDNEYNYLYWINELNIGSNKLEIQIWTMAKITYRKFKLTKIILILMFTLFILETIYLLLIVFI